MLVPDAFAPRAQCPSFAVASIAPASTWSDAGRAGSCYDTFICGPALPCRDVLPPCFAAAVSTCYRHINCRLFSPRCLMPRLPLSPTRTTSSRRHRCHVPTRPESVGGGMPCYVPARVSGGNLSDSKLPIASQHPVRHYMFLCPPPQKRKLFY